jgi:hypothetical protein
MVICINNRIDRTLTVAPMNPSPDQSANPADSPTRITRMASAIAALSVADDLDREILETEQRRDRQQELIAWLARQGEPLVIAERLLSEIEVTLDHLRVHRTLRACSQRSRRA